MKLGQLLRERDRCLKNAFLCRTTGDYADKALRFDRGRKCRREAAEWEGKATDIEDQLDTVNV